MVRGTFKSLITAEFELQMDSRKHSRKCDFECMSRRTQRKLKKAIKILRRTIKKEKFTVRYEGFNYEVIKKSFKADKHYDMTCKHGSILKNNICIACSIGTYMSKHEKKCLPCPSGTFQDEEGRTECKKCPSKIPNSGVEGAANALQCLELCEPGHYSEEGLKPCKPCEIGKYQPQYGRTMCMPCGPGLLTRKIAASHFRDCTTKEVCRKGYFYNLRRQRCEQCKHGTYQPSSGENFCIPCPVGTTTDFRSSTDSSDCKNRRCGGYRGYYQGVIETPNYPGNYPINVGCTWKIKPEKHRRILIIIPQIELEANGKCGDRLVIRKSKSDESQNTFDTCRSQVRPVAFTTRSKKIWINFRSNNNNTAKGFSIPFVTYHEQYQSLIEDIVQDKKLYNSKQHQQIFQDRKILKALLEVIAQPYNYLKYANVSHTMFPRSFFRLLKPKVRKFFST
ncbi:hypothetical protein LOTGIDRAFT_181491 [Lottia gigantea]|uniref:CUB domain-containing protein n=1 Tax=Lottia gigantea TaxID=225164 RepID=V4A104_LOTGI|nr:hypothetical protein LOTGIDRAFT_181491 [Lottia gigantea]ESO97498.1 hypothetical protein LOTGIDRAFT_181491 [Lottia gigantea]